MVVVLGTSSGFVTEAPTEDPVGSDYQIDDRAEVTKDISPAGAIKITEIGWYTGYPAEQEEVNFEVGLYAADGETVPGEAGTLLYSNTTNAKGTTVGWKTVAVDWEIDPNTAYWLGVQLDDTTPNTYIDRRTSFGLGIDWRPGMTTLPNPFGGGILLDADGMFAIYALVEVEAVGTNMQINISDVFKDIESLKINIGNAWKNVIKVQQNIGDVWKNVFG